MWHQDWRFQLLIQNVSSVANRKYCAFVAQRRSFAEDASFTRVLYSHQIVFRHSIFELKCSQTR